MFPNRPTVLWVEDAPDILALAQIAAANHKWNILTSARPESALALYNDRKPDAVVLDVKLPTFSTDDQGSGFDICRKIRSDDSNIVIIIVTGLDAVIAKPEGLAAGADWVYVKTVDFDFDRTFDKMESLLAIRHVAEKVTEKVMPQSHRQTGGSWFTNREMAVFAINAVFILAVIALMGILTGCVMSIRDDISLLKGQAIATDKAVSRIQGKSDAQQEKK